MKKENEYRLYYDELGVPTGITVNEKIAGNYIRINKAIYDRPAFNLLRVINGRLTRYDPTTDVFLLHKVEESKYRSLKNHASILTSDGEGQHYGFKYH